jgi:5,5'-dehydrodivanillate O-demethylase oxygenase subunit
MLPFNEPSAQGERFQMASNNIENRPYPPFEDFDHSGPGTLMGRYLRRFWQPVQIASDLVVGYPKQIRVMSEDFTLYRGESGTPYMVAPHCAHRQTQLSIGWVEGETINCRYHGWGFDGTGQCVSMPSEASPFCEKVKIRSYPVREYAGFIFAYMGEGEPPEFDRYPTLEADTAIVVPFANRHNYNTYNNMENDPLHFPFTHRGALGGAFTGTAPRVRCEPTPWGIAAHCDYENAPSQTMQWGMPNRSWIPGGTAEGADAELGVWTEHISWKVQTDDESGIHYMALISHVPVENQKEYLRRRKAKAEAWAADGKVRKPFWELAADVLEGRRRVDDIDADEVDPPSMGLILVQDHVTQGGQGKMQQDRRKDMLGKSDSFIFTFRKLIINDLRALHEGREPKQWRFVEDQTMISGRGEVTPPMDMRGNLAVLGQR